MHAEFLFDVIQETAQVLGVNQLPISGGHPHMDVLVEWLNRTLKQILSKIVWQWSVPATTLIK